jgi:hypothetical protein
MKNHPRLRSASAPHARRAGATLTSGGVDLVLYGQVLMAVFFTVCVALHPGFVLKRDEGGVSNFGVHLKTCIPYSAAYAAAGVSSWIVGTRARAPGGLHDVGRILRVYAVLLMVTLTTTYFYTLSILSHDLHIMVGGVLFAFEVMTSWWMVRRLGRRRDWLWLAVQWTGSVLAALTIAGTLEVLFLSQVIAGVGYAVVLVSYCRSRVRDEGVGEVGVHDSA